jgi:glutamyl-tRNA synthetase
MKAMHDEQLAMPVGEQLKKRGIAADERLPRICGLFKDRCDTTNVLADWAQRFYIDVEPNADEVKKHIHDGVRPAISMLAKMLEACPWTKEDIAEAVKETLRATGLKMPQLAMPVRVLVMGTAQTPSLDAVLALSLRERVLERLRSA